MEPRDPRPILFFFSSRRSGHARRMASLVSWISVTEKRKLRVVQVDIDRHQRLASALDVSSTPALLLLQRGGVVNRLEGRVTGSQIAGFLKRNLKQPGD